MKGLPAMSAFVVGKAHIDALVTLAIQGPSDAAYGHWSPLPWSARPVTVAMSAEHRAAARRSAGHGIADRIGAMLWLENILSVYYSYEDAGLSDCDNPREYQWQPSNPRPTALEGLKAIQCYEYQSCEHLGWQGSEAYQFCQALRNALVFSLPGWDEAKGWQWSAE
jgi:hypothetical protein